jgi:RES domain
MLTEGISDHALRGHWSANQSQGGLRICDTRRNKSTFKLEMETCEAEVRHRLKDAKSAAPFDRYFQLIACSFSGVTVGLCGKEKDYPELVSKTEEGYPFCQALAVQARNSGIDGLQTPSARNTGGICTPIFSRSALANPRFVDAPRITI